MWCAECLVWLLSGEQTDGFPRPVDSPIVLGPMADKVSLSNFSGASLIRRRPRHLSCFFEKAEFKGLLRDDLFEALSLPTQFLTSSVVAARAVPPASRVFSASILQWLR